MRGNGSGRPGGRPEDQPSLLHQAAGQEGAGWPRVPSAAPELTAARVYPRNFIFIESGYS